MTNINCVADCIYQKDGKCSFEKISPKVVTPGSNCAYFDSKNNNELKGRKLYVQTKFMK